MKAVRGSKLASVRSYQWHEFEPFRHESNSDQPLWRSAIAAPEPTEFAVKLIVPLACRHFKAARAGFAATHLNHAWMCLVRGDPPIEAISPQIDQSTATTQPFLDPIQHLRCVVLRVRSRQDTTIGIEEADTFLMQDVVGEDVIVYATLFQPIDDVQIGIEVPDPALWAHVEDRTLGGAVT